jgi:hypothetical protein
MFAFFRKQNLDGVAPPDYGSLSKMSNFTKGELKHLFVRFNSICNQELQVVEKVPFLQQPELALSPLIPLAYDMEVRKLTMSSQNKDSILGLDFEHYVKILSVFSQKASNNSKLSCK